MRGGYYQIPPIRPELQAAYDEMKATGQFFAFAVCQMWDAKSWEVNTKQSNIYCALDERFSTKEEAHAAGAAWLEKQEKCVVYRAFWAPLESLCDSFSAF